MLPNANSFQMQLMLVETVQLLTSDIQSVLHLRSRSRHWFAALSIMFWSKRRHSSINRSFRWSISWIWQRG